MEGHVNLIGGVGLEAYLSVAAALFVIGVFGIFLLFSNVIALVGMFIALWIAKARDARKAGRPF